MAGQSKFEGLNARTPVMSPVRRTAMLRAKATMSLEDSKRFHEQIRKNKANAMLGRLNNS